MQIESLVQGSDIVAVVQIQGEDTVIRDAENSYRCLLVSPVQLLKGDGYDKDFYFLATRAKRRARLLIGFEEPYMEDDGQYIVFGRRAFGLAGKKDLRVYRRVVVLGTDSLPAVRQVVTSMDEEIGSGLD